VPPTIKLLFHTFYFFLFCDVDSVSNDPNKVSVFIEKGFFGGELGERFSICHPEREAEKMKIMTARLGEVEIDTSNIITFPDGVIGFPVDSTRSMNIETDKRFYGLSLDLGTFAEHWDFNTFIINQDVNGITDRQAIGGEVRYFQPERSFFSLVDYDMYYSELNTFLFVGNWMFPTKTTFNISLDYRKSPVLTTSNALISQTVDSVADLLGSFSEDEVRNLAEDRTAETKSLTVGVSHPINHKFQVSGDITVSELTGTEASGGVEATAGTGNEYFLSSQIIGNSLIKEGDIAILGVRYSDTDSYQTTALNLNTRYPINRDWRINPRLQFDYRTNNQSSGTQSTIRPSIRMDYRWKRRIRFEFEAGGEWSNEKLSDQTDKTSAYFFNSGYRLDF